MVARPQPHDDDSETIDPYQFEGIRMLTREEARAMFDRSVMKTLGISGEEFLHRWDNGEFRDIPDTREGREISGLIMLLPFARPTTF
jgi:hypothetical protein